MGVQEANFFKKARVGDSITLKGSIAEEVAQVTFIQGVIERDGDRIAELVTKLYEVKGEAEFDSLIAKDRYREGREKAPVNQGQPPVFLTSDLSRKLYSYVHSTDLGADLITLKIACPDEFDAFDGHFPGRSHLTGIVLWIMPSWPWN